MKQAHEGYDMSVKRYVAEDMRQALKQIRDELGPDAVILSNRRVEGGVEIMTSTEDVAALAAAAAPSAVKRFADNSVDSINRTANQQAGQHSLTEGSSEGSFPDGSFPDGSFPDDKVELSSVPSARGRFEKMMGKQSKTAANASLSKMAASSEPAAEAPKTVRRIAVRQRRYIEQQLGGGNLSAAGEAQIDDTFEHLLGQYRQPAENSAVSSENGQVLDAMRSEIESLRLLLKDQMEHTSDDRWALKNPVEAAVVKRLVAKGISARLARKLTTGQQNQHGIDDAWHTTLQNLASAIPTLDDGLINKHGVIALLGATGVGKTTTIAKLAVRYALEHGSDQLALVTTDSYRLAAYEQLRTLGRIIDVPVRQVDEYNSLADVLKSLKHKSMVLIDTAGFHLGDQDRLQQLQLLDDVETPIKKLLVLPSTSQSKVLQSVYELMAEIKLDGCVLSKIDETSSLGEVLSLVVEKQLPVAYITNGQKIPDDIGKACPEKLAQGLNTERLITPSMGHTPFNNIRKPAAVFAGQQL